MHSKVTRQCKKRRGQLCKDPKAQLIIEQGLSDFLCEYAMSVTHILDFLSLMGEMKLLKFETEEYLD
jgi:hypothetical protein